MKAYTREFRRGVLAACDPESEAREVATRFGVSESWVRRIKQERRESGKVAAKTTCIRKRMWDDWSDWLTKKIDARPDNRPEHSSL
jgi:transposase